MTETVIEKFLSPEEVQVTLNREEVKKTARFWADTINKRARSNWFTTKLLIKKFKLGNEEQATGVMDLLVLSGLAHREIRNNEIKYKITMSSQEKIVLLESELVELDQKRSAIISEIERLRSTDTEK